MGSLEFLIWGAFHGRILAFERIGLKTYWQDRLD